MDRIAKSGRVREKEKEKLVKYLEEELKDIPSGCRTDIINKTMSLYHHPSLDSDGELLSGYARGYADEIRLDRKINTTDYGFTAYLDNCDLDLKLYVRDGEVTIYLDKRLGKSKTDGPIFKKNYEEI